MSATPEWAGVPVMIDSGEPVVIAGRRMRAVDVPAYMRERDCRFGTTIPMALVARPGIARAEVLGNCFRIGHHDGTVYFYNAEEPKQPRLELSTTSLSIAVAPFVPDVLGSVEPVRELDHCEGAQAISLEGVDGQAPEPVEAAEPTDRGDVADAVGDAESPEGARESRLCETAPGPVSNRSATAEAVPTVEAPTPVPSSTDAKADSSGSVEFIDEGDSLDGGKMAESEQPGTAGIASLSGFDPPIRIQIATSHGALLTKTAKLVNGALEVSAAPHPVVNWIETREIRSMAELRSLTLELTTNQALCLATRPYPVGAKVVTVAQFKSQRDTITRSKTHLPFEPGAPAFMYFDRDGSATDQISGPLLQQTLRDVIPHFESLAALATHSSSSFISDTRGKVLKGKGNRHIYLAVKNGADITRFKEAVGGRLWLAGHGRGFVSAAGVYMNRTVFDLAVFSPERLVFEAGVVVGPGLTQKRPAPELREGAMLDTSVVKSLTEAELAEVARLQSAVRASMGNEIAAKRAAYVERRVDEQVERGVSPERARQSVERSLDGECLDPDLPLYFDRLNGEAVTVRDVLAHALDFDRWTLADPLEPQYGATAGGLGRGKAKFCASSDEGIATIRSYAHGGREYPLEPRPSRPSPEEVFEVLAVPESPSAAPPPPTLSMPWGVRHGAHGGGPGGEPLNEAGNADRMARILAGRARFVSELGVWMVWRGDDERGRAWLSDDGRGTITEAAKRIAAELLDAVPRASSKEDRLSLLGWAHSSQNRRTIDNAIDLMQRKATVRVSATNLNANPKIVGFDGARQVIELETGTVRPACLEDLVTKSLGVATFGEADQAVRWLRFLDEVFQGERDLIEWVRRLAGYVLTGETRAQQLTIGFGTGRNGKSVFVATLQALLGDYACTIPAAVLMEGTRTTGNAASPEIAKLAGCRLVTCSESNEHDTLNSGFVKSITGGDRLTARHLHQAPFDFVPTFKLLMVTNHKPRVQDNGDAMWRRMHPLPFRRAFDEREADPLLLEKLRAELPHILAWAVTGSVEWYAHGLGATPSAIRDEAAAYRAESDSLGAWIEDEARIEPGLWTSTADLYQSYQAYLATTGGRPTSLATFGRRLHRPGIVTEKRQGRRGMLGIALQRVNSFTT